MRMTVAESHPLSFRVESLKPMDVSMVHAWLQDALMRNFTDFPSCAIDFYRAAWNEAKLAETDGVRIICRAGNVPVGICLGTGVEGGVGTVVWMLVDESMRGSGAGRMIFEAAVEAYRALGAHKIKLTAQNAKAVAFYQAVGMKVEGEHPKHWWGMHFTSLGYLL